MNDLHDINLQFNGRLYEIRIRYIMLFITNSSGVHIRIEYMFKKLYIVHTCIQIKFIFFLIFIKTKYSKVKKRRGFIN
jgi:hypothetical protein